MTPALLMVAALCALPMSPADRLDREWLRLIQITEGADCPVALLSREGRMIGFNGHSNEYWRVKTCYGEAEYEVTFWPNDYFPKRASEFEIRPIVPSQSSPTR